tara:strand:- start:123 stop:494 length:372 start_codon:yes stop_codon:yes gene_type:complete
MGRNIPDSAVGACNTTDECTSGTYCVFSVSRQDGADAVWAQSYCGSLADCQVPETEPEDDTDSLEEWWNDWFGDEDGNGRGMRTGSGTRQFCKEFSMRRRGEDSAFRLFSAGAAAAVAVAMTL